MSFAPAEGSTTLAYGMHDIDSLAAHEAYRARLRDDPAGREAFAFARTERFMTVEDRSWLCRVAP